MADLNAESGATNVVAPGPSSAPQPVKLEAGSDMKSKTLSQLECEGTRGTGILAQIANGYNTPFPYADSQFVQVLSLDMADYFGSIWTTLVTTIYPDSSYESAALITQQEFILVCRYLTKARIDNVYSATSGLRPTNFITIPCEFEVPKCLADVINGIGTYTINSGAFLVIPEPAPEDAATALHNAVHHAILSKFSSLVKAAYARGFIRVATISSVVPGTAWWLLIARDPTDVTTLAHQLDRVQVLSVFREWTPIDGLLCAIVQRRNDGLIPDYLTGPTWGFDIVGGISGLRNTFNLEA